MAKVKPKFKVGDIIQDKSDPTWIREIIEIKDTGYLVSVVGSIQSSVILSFSYIHINYKISINFMKNSKLKSEIRDWLK